jgi:XRE family aerobic/anaerobic benzoate catabolism transcriptional regulator
MRNGPIVQGTEKSVRREGAEPNPRNATENTALPEVEYLRVLGERVRSARARCGMTRKNLAKKSGVSERYLAQLETGKGNVSILLLRQVAYALNVPIDAIVLDGEEPSREQTQIQEVLRSLAPEQLQRTHRWLLEQYGVQEKAARKSRIALIGLRGAGKSTLGALLAEKLDVPFLELDRLVEQESGLTLSAIFDLYGPAGFHRFEKQCLERLLSRYSRFVLAAGGSLVTEPTTFDTLLAACHTVWLRAKPEDHMNRVIAQGDRRPMAANPQAMSDLRRILASREPLYGRADNTLETSGKSVKESLKELIGIVSNERAVEI